MDERPVGAAAVMDMREWHADQFNPSAHQKRPRDVEITSTAAFTAVNGYSPDLRERDPLDEQKWKRRRHSSQPNASVWDTNVQTSLWLAQQNNLAPIASMSREDDRQPCQANESEQAFSRDTESLTRAPNWSRRVEEIETAHSPEGRGLATREFSSSANASELI